MTRSAYWGTRPSFSKHFWTHINKRGHDECWPWTATTRASGYGQTLMRDEYGRLHNVSAHRVSYWLTHGPFDWNLRVCHRCDNPTCCNPAHLFLGTTLDNVRDRVHKGRSGPRGRSQFVTNPPRGEKNVKAKLTVDNVRTIRTWHENGHSPYDIAFLFGVCYSTVNEIVNRRHWKHVA